MRQVCLLHTSDLHDHLTPEKAAVLRALKEEHEALLIDTGDAVRAPNVAVMPWRERAISLMNEAGYDAMGLGNREYFFRNWGMAWKTGHARFPRVASNLYGGTGVRSYCTLEVSGVRVGLMALMPTMIAPDHVFEWVANNRFRPWQWSAAAAVGALRAQCDLVVALFHRPADEIAELTALCPEVRLILAGHAHATEVHTEPLSDAPYVSFAGEGARQARLIRLRSPEGTVTMSRLLDLG
jgi:2',3'-cyclic-nucleotide 2'-phosphodiesterase (5'-nucleotidase family)